MPVAGTPRMLDPLRVGHDVNQAAKQPRDYLCLDLSGGTSEIYTPVSTPLFENTPTGR